MFSLGHVQACGGESPHANARQSPALKQISLLLCSSLLPQLECIRLKHLGAALLEPDALQLGGAAGGGLMQLEAAPLLAQLSTAQI